MNWNTLRLILVFMVMQICSCGQNDKELSASGPSLSFVSERIFMKVDSGRLTLEGKYTFRRYGTKHNNFTVSYPFPVNDVMLFPDSIAVCRDIDGLNVPFNKHIERDSVSFAVPFADDDTVTVTVLYTQPLTSHEARYILTTTAAWGRPLEHAELIVSVPDSLEHVTLSYTPDLTDFRDHRIIYSIQRNNFMPGRDLIVRW